MSQPVETLLFQIAAAGLVPPVTELRFHPMRKWRWDLSWPGHLLACEVAGGVFLAGRHTQGVGYTNDCEKTAEALCLGWRVLTVTPAQITNGQALAWLTRLLANPAVPA